MSLKEEEQMFQEPKTKAKRTSKTLWFNGLALVVAIAAPVLASQGFTGEVPVELKDFVPAGIAAINMILRYFFTSTSLRG
jgi:hypothetical protein